MYVTAHRASDEGTGASGINAFLYLQGGLAHRVTGDWTGDDVDRVTFHEPGTLAKQQAALDPGGNLVISYLDVIAPDGTAATRIAAALDAFAAVIGTDEIPVFRVIDHIAIRFSLGLRLDDVQADEYENLSKAIRAILRSSASTA
jgi:hypothetical protein